MRKLAVIIGTGALCVVIVAANEKFAWRTIATVVVAITLIALGFIPRRNGGRTLLLNERQILVSLNTSLGEVLLHTDAIAEKILHARDEAPGIIQKLADDGLIAPSKKHANMWYITRFGQRILKANA